MPAVPSPPWRGGSFKFKLGPFIRAGPAWCFSTARKSAPMSHTARHLPLLRQQHSTVQCGRMLLISTGPPPWLAKRSTVECSATGDVRRRLDLVNSGFGRSVGRLARLFESQGPLFGSPWDCFPSLRGLFSRSFKLPMDGFAVDGTRSVQTESSGGRGRSGSGVGHCMVRMS